MKTSKNIKAFGVAMAAVLCLCCVGCKFMYDVLLTAPYHFDYREMMRETERIEIINIDGSNITVIKVLDDDEKRELLFDLSKIKYTAYHDGGVNKNPQGLTLKIFYYNNTNYALLNHTTQAKFNKDGKYMEGLSIDCPEDVFTNVVSKFMD
jgi:hypothetical protein